MLLDFIMYTYLICVGIAASTISLSAMDGRKMWWAAVEKCEQKTPQEIIRAELESQRKAAEQVASRRRAHYDPQSLVSATLLATGVRLLLRKRY
jgi:hypothetical protein